MGRGLCRYAGLRRDARRGETEKWRAASIAGPGGAAGGQTGTRVEGAAAPSSVGAAATPGAGPGPAGLASRSQQGLGAVTKRLFGALPPPRLHLALWGAGEGSRHPQAALAVWVGVLPDQPTFLAP